MAYDLPPIMAHLGKEAYEGYKLSCKGVSLISGAPLPSWDNQAPSIQAAWAEAAAAAIGAWRQLCEEDGFQRSINKWLTNGGVILFNGPTQSDKEERRAAENN